MKCGFRRKNSLESMNNPRMTYINLRELKNTRKLAIYFLSVEMSLNCRSELCNKNSFLPVIACLDRFIIGFFEKRHQRLFICIFAVEYERKHVRSQLVF